MALIGSINKVSKEIGDVIDIADSLFQKQVILESIDTEDTDTVVLVVTESQNLDMSVEITEKPVADAGAASDYISRLSVPLELKAVLSNRNLDLAGDPFEAITQRVAGVFPGVFSVINSVASIAGDFFDLGKDEIDRSLATLRRWQVNATLIRVKGLRLDLAKYSPLQESVNYLIQSIPATFSKESGDNVDITLTLKEFLNIQAPLTGSKNGSKLTDIITGALDVPNPFASGVDFIGGVPSI